MRVDYNSSDDGIVLFLDLNWQYFSRISFPVT